MRKVKNDQIKQSLYGYEIYNNCKHKQIRRFKIDGDNPFYQRLKKLDESSWCINFLLEYKGKLTLDKFLTKNKKLKTKQVYSIILQIIKIHMILYKGGYSHGDLHTGNIMINKTGRKYFLLNNKKIPYFGYQISAIDYGLAMNKRYKLKHDNYYDSFFKNPEKWLFNELQNNIINFISNYPLKMYCCDKINKKLPWEKNPNITSIYILKILNNNTDFFIEAVKKYIKLYPYAKELIESLYIKRKTIKSIDDIIKNKKTKYIESFYYVLRMIQYEFELKYPKLDKQYFGWCCESKWLLSENESLNFLLLINTKDLINYAINLII